MTLMKRSSFKIQIFFIFFSLIFFFHRSDSFPFFFFSRAGVPGTFFAEDHLQLGRLLHSPQRRMRLEWRIAQVEGIYGNDEHTT